jgi:hypothetical protein
LRGIRDGALLQGCERKEVCGGRFGTRRRTPVFSESWVVEFDDAPWFLGHTFTNYEINTRAVIFALLSLITLCLYLYNFKFS